MGFKRAEWHSGLTYRQTCDQCKTTVQYKDTSLDFRPWYADGFIYCPTCKRPLRHDEKYAIEESVPKTVILETVSETPSGAYGFCIKCGRPFGKSDRFCAACGTKKA